jgi:hypothetical protein
MGLVRPNRKLRLGMSWTLAGAKRADARERQQDKFSSTITATAAHSG